MKMPPRKENACSVKPDERLTRQRYMYSTYTEEDESSEPDVLEHGWGNLSDDEVVHLDPHGVSIPRRVSMHCLTQLDDAPIDMPLARVLNGQISVDLSASSTSIESGRSLTSDDNPRAGSPTVTERDGENPDEYTGAPSSRWSQVRERSTNLIFPV